MKKEFKDIASIVLGFVLLYFIFDRTVLLYTAAAVTIAGLVPPLRKAVLFIWYKGTTFLGWFNSKIILGLVFIVVLTPISLLYKCFNKDKLDLLARKRSTMFKAEQKTYAAEDLEDLW